MPPLLLESVDPLLLESGSPLLLESVEIAGARRIWTGRAVYLARPFAGQGASVYAGGALPLTYRTQRVAGSPACLRLSEAFPAAADSVPKIPRAAQASGSTGQTLAPQLDVSAFAAGPLYLDVRHFRDDIENLIVAPRRFLLDESGDAIGEIGGTAQLLAVEVRAGGVLRIRWRWEPGLSPAADRFRLVALSGPTAPPDQLLPVRGRGLYQLDTPPLDDSAPCTFRLDIETLGAPPITRVIIPEITATPDATGPSAPLALTARAT